MQKAKPISGNSNISNFQFLIEFPCSNLSVYMSSYRSNSMVYMQMIPNLLSSKINEYDSNYIHMCVCVCV